MLDSTRGTPWQTERNGARRTFAIVQRLNADADAKHNTPRNRKRRKELRRLFLYLYDTVLPNAEAGRRAARVMVHHFGVERVHAEHWLDLNAPWLTKRERDKLLRETPQTWSARHLGRYLGLTDAVRHALRITTIAAANVTPAEAKTLAKERKRERDRERRAAVRQAQGAKPRAEYVAKSASQTKP
jgi:hypothetical protein